LANKERSARRQARLAGRLAGRAARVTPDHAAGIVEGARLRSALHELAVTDREALLLVSWEGLDQATAAYVLGCSVTAFKVRLHRARRRLLGLLAATDDAAAHDPANVEAALDPRPEGPR
jgi:RNA polymerase sigma-70 factor (ECF subfamily)